MRYKISGKNITITEGLKTAVTERLDKLDKFFTPETEIQITFSVEKERQKIEVTIFANKTIFRSEQTTTDMYRSIDDAYDSIERQLVKYKNKIVDRNKRQESFAKDYVNSNIEEEDNIKLVKSKKFAIKPMDAEEACLQMELIGHSFFVFRNTETDEVNVVYKRKEGTYGLIEPEC
ncbi:MAG: putative sigma-54 modulation protein [Clostridiales bacterium]|nr:putative sigma-54 modulation protein [Clostridiales bacterium]